MLSDALKTQFLATLQKFQLAIKNHDHPNLALINHLHSEFNNFAPKIGELVVNSAIIQTGVLTIDGSLGELFVVNLTEDVTTLNVVNVSAGKRIEIIFIQDNTGGWTVSPSYPGSFKWEGLPMSPPEVNPTGDSISKLELLTYNGGTTYLIEMKNDYVA